MDPAGLARFLEERCVRTQRGLCNRQTGRRVAALIAVHVLGHPVELEAVLEPARGSGLVVCEPSIVFATIDALFGGAGKFHTRIEGRDFSPTEQRVINRLVEVVSEEYKKAWRGVYPIELAYQRSRSASAAST